MAVCLAVSLLTLFSMTKIWSNAFWGPADSAGGAAATVARPGGRVMLGATGALVALSLAIAAAAGPLHRLTLRAADDLIDPAAYITAVLGR